MQRELDRALRSRAGDPHLEENDLLSRETRLAIRNLRQEVADLKQRLAKHTDHQNGAHHPKTLDDWFTLKHNGGRRITLKEIAHRTKYSYGYVRRKHAQYVAKRRGNKT